MGKIVCCICGKQQSGWIQDYALSKEFYEDRLCVECNEHLQNLIYKEKNKALEEINFFETYLNRDAISNNAKNYLGKIIGVIQDSELQMSVSETWEQSYKESIITENKRTEELKNNLILTTGNKIDGYKIVKYIDVIFEEKIVGVGIKTSLKSFGDIFASLTGEELNAITERINELKVSIKDSLMEKAIKLGANAIIGIDFETTMPAGATIFVSINGTAVRVEEI